MLTILGIIIAIIVILVIFLVEELRIAVFSAFAGAWLIIANWPLDDWWNWVIAIVGMLFLISAIAAIVRLIRG